MAFHESAPSRVWRFGCRPPCENVELIEQQFSLAHRYYNNLIELERRRREQVEAAIQEYSPALSSLTQSIETIGAELAELRQQIKDRSAVERKRTGNAADRARVTELEQRLRAARTLAREERQRLWGEPMPKEENKKKRKAGEPIRLERLGGDREFLDRIETIENAALQRGLALRGGCNVFWGTYLLIERAAQQAAKDAMPGLPHFRRWTGDGQIGVQLQGGLSVADALAGTDSRLRLVMQEGHRSARGQNGVVWLRIGSQGREPVWARFAFRLHRPLPASAVIKWATITRRKFGTHSRYWLNVTLSSAEEGVFDKGDKATSGIVAVNAGWRMLPDGSLRVATWLGSDGEQGFLTIPASDVERWTGANELRSIRDKLFDEVRGKLAVFLEEKRTTLPDWLVSACSHLHQWRSQGRLAVLIGVGEPHPPREGEELRPRWRENRFAGDEEMFTLLDGWMKQDAHLWDWESNQRRTAVGWRDKLYEKLAADLRRQYRELRIAKVDHSRLAERAQPEEEQEAARLARFHRVVASPGLLSALLKREMADVTPVQEPYLTQRCNACGFLDKDHPWDAQEAIEHRCERCGREFDQDINHCKNLLDFPRETTEDSAKGPSDGARGTEGEKGKEVTGKYSQRDGGGEKEKPTRSRRQRKRPENTVIAG